MRPLIEPVHRVIALIAPIALGGCASAHHRTVASTHREVAASEATQRWVVRIAPLLDEDQLPLVVSASSGEASCFVFGSERVSVQDGNATWATEYFAERIVGATQTDASWLFATADGGVFSSTSCAGPLSRVARLPGVRFERSFSMRGGVALGGNDGSLYLADDERVVPVFVGLASSITDAAFSNRHAVILTDDGRAQWSDDFGVTRRDLDIRDPESVGVDDDGLFVQTREDSWRLDRYGRVGPSPVLAATEPLEPEIDDASWWRTDARLLAAATVGFTLSDGTLIAPRAQLAGHSTSVAVVDVAGSRRSIPELPCRASVAPFGDGVIAACARVDGYRVYASRGLHHWIEMLHIPPPPPIPGVMVHPSIVAAPAVDGDGRFVVVDHPCDGVNDPHERRICWFDGVAWRGRHFARRAFRGSIALVGTLLLYAGDGGELDIVDLASPTDAGRRVVLADGFQIESVDVVQPGILAGVAVGPHARERECFIGAPDALSVRALPRGATSVAFADARHAMAAGRTFADVWVSDDGARHWNRLAIPIDGDGLAEADRHADDSVISVLCSPRLCVAGWRVLWLPEADVARLGSARVHGVL